MDVINLKERKDQPGSYKLMRRKRKRTPQPRLKLSIHTRHESASTREC
jgi:hypothetical protein